MTAPSAPWARHAAHSMTSPPRRLRSPRRSAATPRPRRPGRRGRWCCRRSGRRAAPPGARLDGARRPASGERPRPRRAAPPAPRPAPATTTALPCRLRQPRQHRHGLIARWLGRPRCAPPTPPRTCPPEAASPTTAASTGLNRTRIDSLRGASADGRRDPVLGIGSQLVTAPSLTRARAAPVPRRSLPAQPSQPRRPGNDHRPARRTTTPPAPAAHPRRPARPPPAAAPTPTPHETADRHRRAATPTATAHQVPRLTPITTALRSSDVRARSAAETTGRRGRGTESVDNTREKHVAVDSLRNPPVPQHSRQREVLLLAYLAPPGAQQGTAHLSRKSDPGGPLSAWLGERLDPPRRRDGSSYDEERGPQGSVSRASCPQIFDNGPGQRLDARLWTRESRCRDRPTAMPASRADHAAEPGNGREQRGTTQATRLPTPVHQR